MAGELVLTLVGDEETGGLMGNPALLSGAGGRRRRHAERRCRLAAGRPHRQKGQIWLEIVRSKATMALMSISASTRFER